MASVTEKKDRLNAMPEFIALSEEQQESLNRSFTEFANAIKDKKLIAVIRDQERDFAGSGYQQILAKLAELSAAPSADDDGSPGEQGQTSSSGSGCKENPVSFVNINSLNIGFNKAWLATESDVDTYTSKFRELLMEELKKGNRIQI